MSIRDLLFIVPFFFISFFALRPTVPSFDGTWVAFWAALGALGMTMTAWIAMHMFKVIVADEKKRKAEKSSGR
jgi:NADPH:quinone reductase-like Zn-dependent oxidoreductase